MSFEVFFMNFEDTTVTAPLLAILITFPLLLLNFSVRRWSGNPDEPQLAAQKYNLITTVNLVFFLSLYRTNQLPPRCRYQFNLKIESPLMGTFGNKQCRLFLKVCAYLEKRPGCIL